ncbi:MAG: hypothetical protein Q9200_002924 [Gallowayella weberi]
MIIESPIFNDLFIWDFRKTKKALSLDVKDIKSFQGSALSQQGDDQTEGRDDQKSHKNINEVAHDPSSPVDEAQNEDTHGDLDKASADDESNAFNKGPLDKLG